MIPAYSTTEKPIERKDGFAVCYGGNTWYLKPDPRTKKWWSKLTGKRIIVTNLNFKGDPSITDCEPPVGDYLWCSNTNRWKKRYSWWQAPFVPFIILYKAISVQAENYDAVKVKRGIDEQSIRRG